jgi:hypothetical protein
LVAVGPAAQILIDVLLPESDGEITMEVLGWLHIGEVFVEFFPTEMGVNS